MLFKKLIELDPWLSDYKTDLKNIENFCSDRERSLLNSGSIYEFAAGHHYFGLHKSGEDLIIREWLPNATSVTLFGDFCNWDSTQGIKLNALNGGVWEASIGDTLKHNDLYAIWVEWEGGAGKRIPAWATRVVQDDNTKMFNAQAWLPEERYEWRYKAPLNSDKSTLIYEAHIGMAGEEERVHTYNEFRENILPKVKENGYNTVQLMAIQEHPYYGSFGYHVSSFFAPTSRCGTPEELKMLIDEAHGMGIAIIMDIVHSHAVKNENEGIGNYDGTQYQFFHEGERGDHPAWDSFCFNYNKNEVTHFLLSNIRYWLEEFKFDGFRFDGVTSMLYLDHGLERSFNGYSDYYTPNLDYDAIAYLKLANKLIHTINPDAISIAEEMSALPGLATPIESGGIGFNYRMSMGVPDYWIKLIKEVQDDSWAVGDIFHQVTSHRVEESVVSYVESHDQALVGDKTLFFSLVDKEIYTTMRKDQSNPIIERGVALHKMIRLITASNAAGSYLTFMGNEFGHPEWIDFPREGNNWSYKHARRMWSVANNIDLRFSYLANFDKAMISLINRFNLLKCPDSTWVADSPSDQVLAYSRGDLLFVYNFNPNRSFEGYGVEIPSESKYRVVMTTDSHSFGGFNRVNSEMTYYTIGSTESAHQTLTKNSDGTPKVTKKQFLKLYLPSRTATILQKID